MDGVKGLLRSSLGFALKTFWVCFFGSLFFVLVVVALRFASSVSSSDVASWVQAVGSIGAIAGAYAVANWQIQKQRHLQEQQEERRLQSMYAVVRCAAEHVESTRFFVKNQHQGPALAMFWAHMSGTFEASLQALKSVPVHELGRAELVINCMAIIGAMSKIHSTIEQYILANSEDKIQEVYSDAIVHADVASYSWGKFSEFAGVSSELQNYNVN